MMLLTLDFIANLNAPIISIFLIAHDKFWW